MVARPAARAALEAPRSAATLGEIEYRFQAPDGAWRAAAIGPALSAALPFAAALAGFER